MASLMKKSQRAAALSALPILLLVLQFMKKWRRHSAMAALFQQHITDIEQVCGVKCPRPLWLCAPWFALRVFLRSIREHRHLHFLRDMHNVFGPTYSVPLPLQATYIITDCKKNVEHVLKSKFENYVKGHDFFIPRMKDVLGQGIFNADGDSWYHQRKTASHMFTHKKLTNHVWRVIEKNCDKLVAVLLTDVGSTVDVFGVMSRFTLDTIGEIGFARSIGSLDNADSPFLKSFDRAQQISFMRMIMPLWRVRRLLRLGDEWESAHHFQLLREYSLETVRDLKADLQSEKGDSFVGLFMQEADRVGTPYDEDFMRDMVLNFLIAGRDTTAHSLSWTFYLLMRHPDAEKRVCDEIKHVLGSRAPTYEDLNHLPFLQAVINESLRLYPSVPLDVKKSLESDTLPDGTSVDKGDCVVYNIFAMGRSKSIWGDDAEEFSPERWLGKEFPSLYCYPVFNAGPRECLGRRLAWIEMKACLVHVLRSMRLTLMVPQSAIHYDVQLTLGMSSGLPCKVEPRNATVH